MSSNWASVSPGKPTMRSVEKVMPGMARAELADDLEIALPRVPPEHPPEHGVRAALCRQVHVLAHRVGVSAMASMTRGVKSVG